MKRILMFVAAGLLAVSQVQAADDAPLPVPPVPVPPVPAPAPVPGPAPTPPEVFGDWSKKCEIAPDKSEVCYIVQTATNKETGQMVMQVRVGFPPGQTDPIMITTVPLGALLPPGAAFFMGDKEQLKFQFLACDRSGCTTGGAKMTKAVVDLMRKGNEGQIRVALINRQVVPLPVSLKGFTRAYNAIQPKK